MRTNLNQDIFDALLINSSPEILERCFSPRGRTLGVFVWVQILGDLEPLRQILRTIFDLDL